MNLAVIGLGKVGLVLAVGLASAGHRVIGVDIDSDRVNAIHDRSIRVQEPGIAERLRALGTDDLDATVDPDAVRECDAVFVIVPTPSTPGGGFELDFVVSAIDLVGPALGRSAGSPVVSLVSTVMPGASERVIIPALERASGRRVGDGLGYGYNPAFIALGDVLRGFVAPDLVLIGEADEHAGDVLSRIHASMVPVRTPIVRMHPVEAEIAKLASNAHETMRVSFVNMLLAACENTPGSNVDVITDALTFRHGQRLFRGAVPYGGPCWPRDNYALAAYLEDVGAPNGFPLAVHTANDEHAIYLRDRIRGLIPVDEGHVVVAGLAYKPGTDVLDESFGLWLARGLAEDPATSVVGWDPLAADTARSALPATVRVTGDLAEALDGASAVIFAQPLAELMRHDWGDVPDDLVVIDCWRIMKPVPEHLRDRYRPLGAEPMTTRGAHPAVSARRLA